MNWLIEHVPFVVLFAGGVALTAVAWRTQRCRDTLMPLGGCRVTTGKQTVAGTDREQLNRALTDQ